MNEIGKAFAGHAARTEKNPALNVKASRYDNALTDLVSLIIAEMAARTDVVVRFNEENDYN